jgi:hypothetical protein
VRVCRSDHPHAFGGSGGHLKHVSTRLYIQCLRFKLVLISIHPTPLRSLQILLRQQLVQSQRTLNNHGRTVEMLAHSYSPLRRLSQSPSKASTSRRSPKLRFASSTIRSPPNSRPESHHPLVTRSPRSPATFKMNPSLDQRSASLPVSVSLPSNLNLLSASSNTLIENRGQTDLTTILVPETPTLPSLSVRFAAFPLLSTRSSGGTASPIMKRVLTPMPRHYEAHSPASISASYSMPRLQSAPENSGYGSLPSHRKLQKPRRHLPSLSTSRSTTAASDCTLTSFDTTDSVASEDESLDSSSIISRAFSEADSQIENHGRSTAHDLNPASLTRRLGKLLTEPSSPSPTSPVLNYHPTMAHWEDLRAGTPRYLFENTLGSLSGESLASHMMERTWSDTTVSESEHESTVSTISSTIAVEVPEVPANSPVPPSLRSSRASVDTASSFSSSSFARWDHKASQSSCPSAHHRAG